MNITLIQEQMAYIVLALETEDEFEVYGGTTRAPFEFQPTGVASWRVVVRESEVAGSALRPFDIYARQRSTGREWVVLSGKIIVKPRTADIEGEKLSPVEYHVTVPVVDSVLETQGMAIVTGIPGPQGPKGEKGDPGDGNVTAEAIQAVAPIKWDETNVQFGAGSILSKTESVVIGAGAKGEASMSTALGHAAKVFKDYSVAVGKNATCKNSAAISLGYNSNTEGQRSIALGYNTAAKAKYALVLGIRSNSAASAENSITVGQTFSDTSGDYPCTTEGTGSITIGAGANTLNNGDTKSSNSVTIGCKAENKGADSVVIGASASNNAAAGVAIGAGAISKTRGTSIGWGAQGEIGVAIGYKAKAGDSTSVGRDTETGFLGVAIGCQTKAALYATAIGSQVSCNKGYSSALGAKSECVEYWATAIGAYAKAADYGATVIRSTAEDGTYTQLYFSGANTPLANTYHGGAPMLGYVTKDSAGNIVAAGTRSLIELLTDNSTFAPASLDENGEWVAPRVFHPSDLDLPQEEPSEPEEYEPLPVYPIVEPTEDELRTPTQEI